MGGVVNGGGRFGWEWVRFLLAVSRGVIENKRMKLAIVSDTHGLLRPEVFPHLAEVDAILHAGDVGDPAILDMLRERAPLYAIHGNVDFGTLRNKLPPQQTFVLGGHRIHMVHDLAELAFDPVAEGIELVVFGHSHRPTFYQENGVHYLNPGSIGARRFKLPISLALAGWGAAGFEHRFIELIG